MFARISNAVSLPSLENAFAGQEISSDVGYSCRYAGPQPLVEQIQSLASAFGLDPVLALAYAANLPPLPDGAEAWFAVVNDDLPVDRHRSAAARVLQKLTQLGIYGPYTESDTVGLETVPRTNYKFGTVDDQQGWSQILIVAAQLGRRHAGRSVNRAEALLTESEYGLTVAQVGSIVLNHPGLVHGRMALDLVCLGDACPSRVVANTPSVPNIGLSGCSDGEMMAYSIHSRDRVNATVAAVTGFVPA
jgi:hypothetical protein